MLWTVSLRVQVGMYRSMTPRGASRTLVCCLWHVHRVPHVNGILRSLPFQVSVGLLNGRSCFCLRFATKELEWKDGSWVHLVVPMGAGLGRVDSHGSESGQCSSDGEFVGMDMLSSSDLAEEPLLLDMLLFFSSSEAVVLADLWILVIVCS